MISLSQNESFPHISTQKRLLEASHSVPIFHMEDVYLTGMLSRSIGVRPQYHPGFTGTKWPLRNEIRINFTFKKITGNFSFTMTNKRAMAL